jgi:hypothetical protein
MKPDFAHLLPELAAAGRRSVLVAPVQFLADHLEILYDVDIAARGQAERYGLRFHRIDSLNADRGLTDALAAVSRRTLERAEAVRTTKVPGIERPFSSPRWFRLRVLTVISCSSVVPGSWARSP